MSVARQPGFHPSPCTSQHPSGQAPTRIVRVARPREVATAIDVCGGVGVADVRTTRSMSMPDSMPGAVRTTCSSAASARVPEPHSWTAAGSPATRSAQVAGHPDRHRGAVDGEQVVAATGVERAWGAGRARRRRSSPRRRRRAARPVPRCDGRSSSSPSVAAIVIVSVSPVRASKSTAIDPPALADTSTVRVAPPALMSRRVGWAYSAPVRVDSSRWSMVRVVPSGIVSVLGAGVANGVIHAVLGSPSNACQPVATGRPLTRRSARRCGRGAGQRGERVVGGARREAGGDRHTRRRRRRAGRTNARAGARGRRANDRTGRPDRGSSRRRPAWCRTPRPSARAGSMTTSSAGPRPRSTSLNPTAFWPG